MAELDDETLERVRRWCAEAGRQAGSAEIRAALAPLSWDELLHARALLADPPPARPLGPAALADLARGTPSDVAAEREREGRYRGETEELLALAEAPAAESAPAARTTKRGRRSGPRRPIPPVIHRHRDRTEPAAPESPVAPSFERLLEPPGRAVLERLIREHGARRSFLLRELASWRTAQGEAPTDVDLTALLEHHGLARAFAHRERDELLHALRAARGDRAGAATRVGLDREAYERALERLGATADAERLRDERRAEHRARATIAERCRLLATEADRLADLGILEELERDLRDRLGEHLRALRAGTHSASVAVAFARSVSLEPADAAALARRLGVDLDDPERGERPPSASRPASAPRPRGGPRPATGPRPRGGPRSATGPRPRGGPRSATAPRSQGGGRPATAPRSQGGGRPATAPRFQGGARPATAPRFQGGGRPATAPRPRLGGRPSPLRKEGRTSASARGAGPGERPPPRKPISSRSGAGPRPRPGAPRRPRRPGPRDGR